MKFLKSIAEDKQVSIRQLLHENVAAYEPPRSHRTLHASDVVDNDFCARQFALFDLTGKKPHGQFVGTALRLTFQYGRYAQKQFNEVWMRHRMWGDWQCKHCKQTLVARKAPDFRCTKCGGSRWHYKEINVVSAEHGLSGGIDAVVEVGQPKLRIVEIKTLDKDEFKDLKAPMGQHRQRTQLYLKLLAQCDHPLASSINQEVGHVLYLSKSFGFKDPEIENWDHKDAPFTPFKEFLVWRDDDSVQPGLDRAKMLKTFRDGGPIPSGPCANSFDKRAKGCHMASVCFSGKYPAGAQQQVELQHGD